MTPKRRIFLNIIATYGRSLYAIIVGLFCGRWTYLALGEVDYGLMGVIGALTVLITYLNEVLSSAICRYYAISVGEEQVNYQHGLEASRKWFTAAFVVQSVVPTFLLISGYPLGVYAIRCFLTIPVDRLESCVWVWRFVCVSSYLSMLCVPWRSMYIARQYIAELTIYSIVTTTLNAIFLYYMVEHPQMWLAKFAFWQCCLNILPTLIIAIRAHFLFPECRIVKRYLKCGDSVKEMVSYAGWNALGLLGFIARSQGITVLVNKFFGVRANTGFAVGNTIAGHCNMLSSSLNGAFSPAIFNAWGASEYGSAKDMSFRVCKYGSVLLMIFAIPLALEIDKVLEIWLKSPPQYASEFCILALLVGLIDKLAFGHAICIQANGRVAKYQIFEGLSYIATLPIAWLLIKVGFGVCSAGWALIVSAMLGTMVRVLMAKELIDCGAREWITRVLLPIFEILICGIVIGSIPKFLMEASFWRILVTVLCVEIPTAIACWFLVFDSIDRDFLCKKIKILSYMRSRV